MMKPRSIVSVAVGMALVLLAACGRQEAPLGTTKFDPGFIAAEADKGNLEPLKELNAACSAEVEKTGERNKYCATQDEVRKLSKPINIRF